MNYPKAIEELIQSFAKLPSVGRKTAERLALYVYSKMSEEDAAKFAENLLCVKSKIKHCSICGNMSENDICDICNNIERKHDTIMVVENVRDLFVIEKINDYQGIYHVLNGAISFSKGIGIDDINVTPLIDKVKKGEIKEVILSTNATLEGETTARYIKALLEDYNIKITRIAHGLPVGGDLQYADEMTLLKALEGRREY